jgi:hypothetical protein
MSDSHLEDDVLLAGVRRATDAFDPVPDGMVRADGGCHRDIADHDPDLEPS